MFFTKRARKSYQKYKNYFIVENYRGNENIKYKANILELFKNNSLFASF